MNILDPGFGPLEAQLWQVLFLSIRVGAALMAAPVMGAMTVPTEVRVLLAVVLGFFVASWMPPTLAPPMLSLDAVLAVVQEAVLGAMLGFVLQIAFAVPLIAAEQISGTMGLALATSIDPASGAQSGALGTFLGLVLMLIFYVAGGHLLWFELVLESHRLLPAGQFALDPARGRELALFMGYALATAAALALPVVLVLLLVQLTIGLIARSAPSLNLLAIGLGAGVIAGIAALIVALPVMSLQLNATIAAALEQGAALTAPGTAR